MMRLIERPTMRCGRYRLIGDDNCNSVGDPLEFHFLSEPLNALQGMQHALVKEGKCLVSFESDNLIRRLAIFFGLGSANQRYYRIRDVEDIFLKAGFKVVRSGAVMRIPVTLYRRCPRSLLWILKRLERLWPWPMHDYVLGEK
jgi:hypothetical protein